MEFAQRMNRFGEEIFAALNVKKLALESQWRKIWNMSIGTPDFETTEHIRNALVESAKDPASWKYTLRDLPELTQAVSDYYLRR